MQRSSTLGSIQHNNILKSNLDGDAIFCQTVVCEYVKHCRNIALPYSGYYIM